MGMRRGHPVWRYRGYSAVDAVRNQLATDAIPMTELQNIAESPLFGVGWHEAGGSESSWLGGFAGYGILMFALMWSEKFAELETAARAAAQVPGPTSVIVS